MVERPVDEEPAIAATEAPEEPKPAAPKRGRRKKAEAEGTLSEPAPAPPEAPPAETSEEAPPAEKPVRKRRSKKAEVAEDRAASEPTPEPAPPPAPNNDTVDEQTGELRRGWWQRTFG